MKVLACVVEGVAPSGRRQPALIGESVGMLVRHHTALQAILDELCQQLWTLHSEPYGKLKITSGRPALPRTVTSTATVLCFAAFYGSANAANIECRSQRRHWLTTWHVVFGRISQYRTVAHHINLANKKTVRSLLILLLHPNTTLFLYVSLQHCTPYSSNQRWK